MSFRSKCAAVVLRLFFVLLWALAPTCAVSARPLSGLPSINSLQFAAQTVPPPYSTQTNKSKPVAAKQPPQANSQTPAKLPEYLEQYPRVKPPASDPDQPTAPGARQTNPSDLLRRLPTGSEVVIEFDRVRKEGDLVTYEGYVNVTFGIYRLQADRVVYNDKTKDMLAEGNVIFDAGTEARVTASRTEINTATRRGVFYDTTGFTNRTRDGRWMYFTAAKIEKVDDTTYVLHDTTVTACEGAVPVWSFTAKETKIEVGDRVKLNGAVFRVKRLPVLYLPFASLPISPRERKSGFLLPESGSSTQKGRTLSVPYYQTLGRSADIILRGDIYTRRAVGVGYEARLRTDERSFLRLGGLVVKDGLFGYEGPKQGGSSFFAAGVQYFPKGWIAVADVNITSSLIFRQVFSDDYEEIVNPEERSTLYINRNFNGYSLNLLGQSRTTTIQVGDQRNFTPLINLRQLPSVELASQPRPLNSWRPATGRHWPLYFSFESALEGVHRSERISNVQVLGSPSVVQRLDIFPKLIMPLPSVGDWAVTPSLGFRTTFYSDSLDPLAPVFDPARFALTADDPRLNPQRPEFDRTIGLFNPLARPRIRSNDLTRTYSELAVDIRPPVLGKTYRRTDGTRRFTHVIEPQLTYRRIDGLNNVEFVPRFDERDAVGRTNQLEYALVNRFFRTRTSRASNETPQSQEVLAVKVSQYYFFDPTFGGALLPGQRNQFYPLNRLTAFVYGARPRHFSPVNVQTRVRPVSAMFADLRLDYDPDMWRLRNVVASGGYNDDRMTVEQAWYYVRRMKQPGGEFEPGTFFGNQYRTTFIYGQGERGWYGGTSLNLDLVDRTVDNQFSSTRLLRSSSFIGFMGKCCGVEVGYQTFNAGVRVESRLSFSFTLAGIGRIGARNQIGQPGRDGWYRNQFIP